MVTLLLMMSLLRFIACHSQEVRYVVNMDSEMEPCEDESAAYVDCSNVITERYNETIAYMYGDMNFLQDMGDNLMLEIVLMKEASGNYEILYSIEVNDFCGEMEKGSGSNIYRYLKYFGLPATCPIDAGEYPIKEFIVDTDELPLNSNTCGRYKADMTIYKNPEPGSDSGKVFMFCVSMKLLIEVDY